MYFLNLAIQCTVVASEVRNAVQVPQTDFDGLVCASVYACVRVCVCMRERERNRRERERERMCAQSAEWLSALQLYLHARIKPSVDLLCEL